MSILSLGYWLAVVLTCCCTGLLLYCLAVVLSYYRTVVLFFCCTILIYMQPCFIYGLILLYRFAVAVPSAQQFVAKVNIFRIRSLAESYRKSPLSLLSPCLLGDLQHSSIGKYHKKQEEHGVIGEELHAKASSQNPKEGRHNQGSHIG